jgi:hypothetical protein
LIPTVRIFALLCLIAMSIVMPAHAGIDDAPGANLQISLITYGPGATYWERFGHDAIEVRDGVSGQSVDFNYGVFDFNESNFFINFARGHMHYMMDAEASAPEQDSYMQDGRSVTRQQLALSPVQAGALRDFLLWNLRPENAGYSYDYYADNCSTRVRDALDKAVGGVIKPALGARAGHMTYRQQTARLMSAQPWLMLVLDLGLGPYADHPLNAWQESFLPEVLQARLRDIRIDDGHGGTMPLVRHEQMLAPNRLDVPPARAPDLLLPLGIAGLAIAAAIVALRRAWAIGFALLGSLYLLAAGFVGLVLLGLWLLTDHHSAWANANLLLFNPLAWLLLPSLWRARRGFSPSRFIDGVIVLQLVLVLIAVLLHLLPGVVQQNQPWLLFGLPCWLALTWSLRKKA